MGASCFFFVYPYFLLYTMFVDAVSGAAQLASAWRCNLTPSMATLASFRLIYQCEHSKIKRCR